MTEDELVAAMTAVIEQHHPSPDHVLGQTPAAEIARELLPVVRRGAAPETWLETVDRTPHSDQASQVVRRALAIAMDEAERAKND